MEMWWEWNQGITGGDGNLQFADRAELCNEIMQQVANSPVDRLGCIYFKAKLNPRDMAHFDDLE